jgi:hypothetical protein
VDTGRADIALVVDTGRADTALVVDIGREDIGPAVEIAGTGKEPELEPYLPQPLTGQLGRIEMFGPQGTPQTRVYSRIDSLFSGITASGSRLPCDLFSLV